jgi:hypothetical protein
MSAHLAECGMSSHVELNDPGNAMEVAAYGIGKIEPLGSFTRVYFFMPKTISGVASNDVVLTMIVPTDQVGAMSRALGIDVGPRGERVLAWNRSQQTGTC